MLPRASPSSQPIQPRADLIAQDVSSRFGIVRRPSEPARLRQPVCFDPRRVGDMRPVLRQRPSRRPDIHGDAFANSAQRESRFSTGLWGEEDIIPRLADAAASFLCLKDQMLRYGTHSIVIGHVIGTRMPTDTAPLFYVARRFAGVAFG